MSQQLLPIGSSQFEQLTAQALADLSALPIHVSSLWDPWSCPAELLPWLAWSLSVDYWDSHWNEQTKRKTIATAYFVHKHKGTVSALRQVILSLGYTMTLTEWWQTSDPVGTFRITVNINSAGITELMYQELTRLINDVKPLGRHLLELALALETTGQIYTSGALRQGDELTIYPWISENIVIQGEPLYCAVLQHIDAMRINYE